jgi:hypothetical protein
VERSGDWLIADDAASLEQDDFKFNQCHQLRHCERSEAIQGRKKDWIASSQELLAMTELTIPI